MKKMTPEESWGKIMKLEYELKRANHIISLYESQHKYLSECLAECKMELTREKVSGSVEGKEALLIERVKCLDKKIKKQEKASDDYRDKCKRENKPPSFILPIDYYARDKATEELLSFRLGMGYDKDSSTIKVTKLSNNEVVVRMKVYDDIPSIAEIDDNPFHCEKCGIEREYKFGFAYCKCPKCGSLRMV